jgi:flagellar biogenesis protein FliO
MMHAFFACFLGWALLIASQAAGAASAPANSGATNENVQSPASPVATDGVAPTDHLALGEDPIRNTPATDAPTPQTTPALPSSGMDYPRVIAAMGIVIGLIFLLRWCGRFVFPAAVRRGSSRAIEVISRAALSPRQQVMLIRVGRRLIVVGDSGSQMNPLCEITDPDEMAALVGQLQGEKTVVSGSAFGSLFKRSRGRFDVADEPEIASPPPLEDPEDEVPVASAREELNGLRDRVRLLAEQYKSA